MSSPMAVLTYASILLLTAVSAGASPPDTATRAVTTWLDAQLQTVQAEKGVQQIRVADDATFLRRVHLDLTGRIPTVAEVRDFLEDPSSGKRLAAIDRLMESERFNEHQARVWRRTLMPPSSKPNAQLAQRLDEWFADQFGADRPFDQIATSLVTAGGAESPDAQNAHAAVAEAVATGTPSGKTTRLTSPISYLQHVGNQPAAMTSSVARVFLGMSIECAQCHDHPFAAWKQADFWGMAAFFAGARVFDGAPASGVEGAASPPADIRTSTVSDEQGRTYSVALPWQQAGQEIEIAPDELPRQYFARWLTSPANKHFAATIVNRVWQQLCGQGLTPAVDDLDGPSEMKAERAILDGLATRFAAAGFDTRVLIRAICASQYYQRASDLTDGAVDTQDARPLTVLTPDQLFDSLEVALGLPISRMDRGPRYNGARTALVMRMDESFGDTPVQFRLGVPQALQLMNGNIIAEATDLSKARTLRAIVHSPFADWRERLDVLFLATLSRYPTAAEQQAFLAQFDQVDSDDERAAMMADIMWALLNSPDFILIR